MNIVKPIWRGFCLFSGLVMAPVLLALVLASGMGVLPPLDRIRAALLDSQSANAASDGSNVATKPGSSVPDDARYWERRLNGVSSTIARDRAEVDQRLKEAKASEEKLAEVKQSLEKLLEAALDREFAGDQLVVESEAIRDELDRLVSEEQRFPAVLETAKTMSPKALASILTPKPGEGDAEEAANSKKHAAKLLRRLKPRTTGKVLEAMAKIDAVYARELIQTMGEAATGILAGGQ